MRRIFLLLYRPLFSSISLRMRKFITTAFLLTFCACVAHAADTDCTTLSKATCNTTPGCYWQTHLTSCAKCPVGTYNDGKLGENATTCLSCGTWDANSNTEWSKTSTGQTSQDACAFTAQCKAAQAFTNDNSWGWGCNACSSKNNALQGIYYYGTKKSGYTINGTWGDINSAINTASVCARCGKNSETSSNGLGCNCKKHHHINGGTNNDTVANGEDCVINTYTITYRANNGTDQTTTQKNVSYDSTVTTLGDQTFSNTGHTLTGWKNDALSLDVTPAGGTFQYTYTTDIELKAQWSAKSFKITYQVGDAGTTCQPANPPSCTYGNKCSAPNIPNGCTYNGYLFNGWKCTSGCNDSNTIISPNTDINDISGGNDMTLTAQWAECPAGYYCPDISTDNECPAGSTSDAKSTAITQCYMVGGTTIILDAADNEFTLPGTTKIYYHGGNN